MFLIRLVYTSEVSDGFNSDDVEEILAKARINNAKSHVTGMLCFNRKYFLQCLEGSRTAVNDTYQMILKDKRHSRILLLDYKEINVREFSNWSMAYTPESSLSAPVNIQHSGTPEFNPYEMSGESAHLMMLALRDSVLSS